MEKLQEFDLTNSASILPHSEEAEAGLPKRVGVIPDNVSTKRVCLNTCIL